MKWFSRWFCSGPYRRYDIDKILQSGSPSEVIIHLHGLLRKPGILLRSHEYQFLAAQEAKIQVPWDGFDGWFHNLNGGSVLKPAVQGLEAIGAPISAEAVRRAITVFPNSDPPNDYEAYEESVHQLTNEQKAFLDEVSDRFSESGEDIGQLSYDWLLANREIFHAAKL